MTSKNVLVTGGAGFIGSHVCSALKRNGFSPVVLDNLSSGNEGAVKWGPFEKADIRDRSRLDEILARYRPEAIMHFAALIKVGESVAHPADYYDNNVLGSLTLLNAARAANVTTMVFSSTAAVYGIPQSERISETHPTCPINPYGQTKLAMEGMIRDYSTAYGLRHAILRYFNAAGADADGALGAAYPETSHLVPMLMQVASGHKPEFGIFGNDYPTADGTAIRDFVHVSDLADAHVLALQHLLNNKGNLTLNLGTNRGHSVNDVLQAARTITGKPIAAKIHPRRAGDPPVLVAEATQAHTVLGWTPARSNLTDILSSAWRWQQLLDRHGQPGAFAANQSKVA